MRHFLTSILAIMVLILSCMPCGDVEAMHVPQKEIPSIKSTPDKDRNSNQATDICSPFCTCSCCAGFALPIQQELNFNNTALFSKRTYASYLPESPVEVFLPIWQPPKLK